MGSAAFAAALISASEPTRGQSPGQVRVDPTLGHTVREIVTTFYSTRPDQGAWTRGAARATAHDLLLAVEQAAQHGLCATPTSALRDWLDGVPAATEFTARANDVRVTETLASHLAQLALGRHTVATGATLSARILDVSSLLEQAAMGRPARDILDVAQPWHREYAQLQQALAVYRGIAAVGGWPRVPRDLRLYPDREGAFEWVTALVTRLRASGDLREAELSAPIASYNSILVAAVRRFQARHGLVVDGIVGPATVAALNVPVERRVEQLALNMDRWRRLSDWLGEPHVRVNIPAFALHVFENGQPELSMRVVVGTPANQTPVFSDRIRYLDFNPYWNVPRSITVNELVPRVAADPEYLKENEFEVLDGWSPDAELIDPAAVDWEAERFSYRLRQLPGPDNALGLVKFMFPNRYHVYLHDTPADHLFGLNHRARSHGCVRIEKPADLAAFLLREIEEWDRQRVVETMRQGDREVVRLRDPVPLHLLYLTAWLDERGNVHFRDDVYDRDAQARQWFTCD